MKPKEPKEPKKPRGRPSKYTDELAKEICDRLSLGEPLAQICRDDHMPAVATVSDWKQAHANFSVGFARAREEGFDVIAESCLEIADDAKNDYMEKLVRDGDEQAKKAMEYDSEHVQRSKLRIETRLKLLAKWDPRRYGEKVETTLKGSLGVTMVASQTDEKL
jgi:hypothetical protein